MSLTFCEHHSILNSFPEAKNVSSVGNMLILDDDQINDELNRSLRLIDFEYASQNYRAYEFGNFFCECCIDNFASEKSGGFQLLKDRFPSKKTRTEFFQCYLKELNCSPGEVSQSQIDSLLLEAHYGVLSSHLFWGLWAIIQAEDSNISWGYREYGLMRFSEYFRIKNTTEV